MEQLRPWQKTTRIHHIFSGEGRTSSVVEWFILYFCSTKAKENCVVKLEVYIIKWNSRCGHAGAPIVIWRSLLALSCSWWCTEPTRWTRRHQPDRPRICPTRSATSWSKIFFPIYNIMDLYEQYFMFSGKKLAKCSITLIVLTWTMPIRPMS